MYVLIFIPFIIQMIVIAVDEYYFHLKRGLPLWERIGHPLDTLTVLACFAFALLVPYSETALKWYLALAVFSCLMVTKDEFVHKHHCPASEIWLHALLFLNHPLVLTCVGFIWYTTAKNHSTNLWVNNWLNHPQEMRNFLWLQSSFIILFLFYQIIYWNFLWKEKSKSL